VPGAQQSQREFFAQKTKMENVMTGLKALVAAALLSISVTPVLAQQESAHLAEYPDRDWLNGGVLTPAARAGLEGPYGAAGNPAASNAYAGPLGPQSAPALRPRRYRAR
jgi:hypothetical protein